ncbi:MAG: hypothetical protein ACLT46_11250 [Hungatella sp.]
MKPRYFTFKHAEDLIMIARELWTAEDDAENVPDTMNFEFQLQLIFSGR